MNKHKAIVLISIVTVSLILTYSYIVVDSQNGTRIEPEPENGTSEPEPQPEPEPEPSFYTPKFHIFDFVFHKCREINGQVIGIPYVSFFVQNIGNLSATSVNVTFNLNISFYDEEYICHPNYIISILEPSETRYFEVDVNCTSSNLLVLHEASAKITCTEGVTEEFALPKVAV